MRYRKTFKLFKYLDEANEFCKSLKNKKFIFTESHAIDGSYNFVVWYFE